MKKAPSANHDADRAARDARGAETTFPGGIHAAPRSPRVGAASRLDLCAASLSTLCLIHCAALPLLATLLPLAGQLSENEMVHRVLALLAVPASLGAIRKALPAPGSLPFIVAALSGLALLLLAAFVEVASAYEQPTTIIGALLLGGAHLWRWTRHRHAGPHDDTAPTTAPLGG